MLWQTCNTRRIQGAADLSKSAISFNFQNVAALCKHNLFNNYFIFSSISIYENEESDVITKNVLKISLNIGFLTEIEFKKFLLSHKHIRVETILYLYKNIYNKILIKQGKFVLKT